MTYHELSLDSHWRTLLTGGDFSGMTVIPCSHRRHGQNKTVLIVLSVSAVWTSYYITVTRLKSPYV